MTMDVETFEGMARDSLVEFKNRWLNAVKFNDTIYPIELPSFPDWLDIFKHWCETDEICLT